MRYRTTIEPDRGALFGGGQTLLPFHKAAILRRWVGQRCSGSRVGSGARTRFARHRARPSRLPSMVRGLRAQCHERARDFVDHRSRSLARGSARGSVRPPGHRSSSEGSPESRAAAGLGLSAVRRSARHTRQLRRASSRRATDILSLSLAVETINTCRAAVPTRVRRGFSTSRSSAALNAWRCRMAPLTRSGCRVHRRPTFALAPMVCVVCERADAILAAPPSPPLRPHPLSPAHHATASTCRAAARCSAPCPDRCPCVARLRRSLEAHLVKLTPQLIRK